MGDDGLEVRCPRCQYFVVRIWAKDAEFDLNCPNTRCPSSIRVKIEEGKLAVTANGRTKKA